MADDKDLTSEENLGMEGPKSKRLSKFPFLLGGVLLSAVVLMIYNGFLDGDKEAQKKAMEEERQRASTTSTGNQELLKDSTTAVYQGKPTKLLDDNKVTNVATSNENIADLKRMLELQQAELERLKNEKNNPRGARNNLQAQQAKEASLEAQALQNMKKQIADMKKQAFISALTSSSKPKKAIGANANGEFEQDTADTDSIASRKAQMQRNLNNVNAQIARLNAGDTGTGTAMGGFGGGGVPPRSPASQLSSSNHMLGYSEPSSDEGKYDLNSYDQMSKQNGWTLKNTLETPNTSYIVRAGFVIPAVLISGINSDIAGQIMGQVSQNVYDTATGHHLLIPQGTRLVGTYTAGATYGQERVMIAWQRLIYPDNKVLDIGSMSGTDLGGYSGFHDKVNNHWWKLISSAFLMSGITASVVIATDRSKNNSNNNSSSNNTNDQLRQAMATQFGNVISRVIERNLNVSPTLEIRAGYQFNVMVTRDIVFKKPYKSFDYSAEGL